MRFAGFVKAALQNKDFVNYGISAVIWNFGVTFLGSLTAVYFVQDLGGNEGAWALVNASSLARRLSASGIGEPLADKFGPKNIMAVSVLPFVLFRRCGFWPLPAGSG